MAGKLILLSIVTLFLIKCDANPPSSRVKGRIVGGTEAARNQFNFQVLMFISLKTNEDSLCSGSIMSQKYVLSAAHCFQNFAIADILAGVHNFEIDDPAYETAIGPSEVKIHEQYNPANFMNDIAIVTLAKSPLVFSIQIQPIKLAPRALVNVNLADRTARLSGWGAFSDMGIPSARLLYIDNLIISASECIRVFGNGFTNNNLCFSGAGRRSACPGDSGGPLTIDYSGNRVQVGIVSFGSQTSCESGYPVVFTQITSYLNWIQTNSDVVVV